MVFCNIIRSMLGHTYKVKDTKNGLDVRVSYNKKAKIFGKRFCAKSHTYIIYRTGILASLILVFALGYFVCPVILKQDVAEGAARESDTMLTIDTSQSSASLDFAVSSTDGTFASTDSTSAAKFTVSTNNYTGYTLTLSGTDDTRQLSNTSTSTDVLDSINATNGIDATTFNTSTYNNQWGFVPNYYNSKANTNFYQAPTTAGVTLDKTTAANSTAKEYTIGLGARVDYSKPAGTYTNTFNVIATANPIGYTITYSKGGISDVVSNLPSTQAGEATVTNVALTPNTTPTRIGYTFKSWCDGTINTTAPSATDLTTGTVCTGTEYTYNSTTQNYGTISFIDQTAPTNAKTLYAVWEPNKYNITIKTAANINEVSLNGTTTTATSGTIVSNLLYNHVYALTATPASGYKIDKWTMSSEAGSIADTTSATTTFTVGLGNNTLTPSATIAATYIQDYTKSTCQTEASSANKTVVDKRDNKEYTVRYINNNCWMTQNLAYMGDTVGSTSSTTTTWYLKSATSNVSADKTMTMQDLTSGNSTTSPMFHDSGNTNYGVYYNYAAASAGSIVSNVTTEASQSVCPAGWRLPTNAEQGTIGSSSGSTTYVSAFSPVYSGYYNNGSPYDVGSYGYWWSSTAGNSTSRYNMYYYSGSLYSGSYDYRGLGYSVRCIRAS